ncbi:phospholipase A2 inhibitor gamma subunit B-like [Mantella aurantiaca]
MTPEFSVSCGTQSQCNLTGSVSFIYGTIRTGTSCCSTDNCTVPIPQLPPVIQNKNGLKCRTCSSDKSDYCYTDDKMDCTGNETKCGRMARTLSGTINLKDSVRGCATRSFCEVMGNQKTSIMGLNVDMKMYCSDGAVGLYNGVVYAISVALLTKLLF